MIVWAVVSGCTAFIKSTAGLLTVRFFLGVVEAPFFPCAIYYLSCWYKKRELGLRMAFLVSGLILCNAFAGLLATAILNGMQGVGSLKTWQWLFIIEALVTIVVAFCAIFILPDYPDTTKWLAEEERTVAQARLAIDVGTEKALTDDTPGALRSLLLAMKDPALDLTATLCSIYLGIIHSIHCRQETGAVNLRRDIRSDCTYRRYRHCCSTRRFQMGKLCNDVPPRRRYIWHLRHHLHMALVDDSNTAREACSIDRHRQQSRQSRQLLRQLLLARRVCARVQAVLGSCLGLHNALSDVYRVHPVLSKPQEQTF